MPDNLRITTPIANTEGISKPNPAGDLNRPAPVNPNRVPRADNNEEAGRQSADLLLNRSSVYSQFIRQFQQTPGLDRTLQKLLGDAVLRQSPADGQTAAAQGLPSSLRALAAAIAAGEDGILEGLVSQQEDATLFTGPLFKLLEQISAQSGDPQFDLRLADFLKAYSGFSSAAGTTQAVLTNLKNLKYSIPAPFAKRLSAVMEKLSNGVSSDYVDSDLAVLKREIIPLLGEYVAKTNDYGKPRDTISMLLHNTAILNESSRENLTVKFGQLLNYCRDSLGLPDMTLDMVRAFFIQETSPGAIKKQDRFLSALTSLLSRASDGKATDGLDRTALNGVSRSILLDNSVFMPFRHIFLPAEVDGRFLFAQMWIEKTDPDETRKPAVGGAQAPKSVYLSFEIQDLGYFEASVRITGKQVSMKLSCPPAFKGLHGEIRSGISGILRQNGLSPDEVRLSSSGKEPQLPHIIMQKIQERKRSVDVSV
jgi:hypothetical protein